MSELFEPDGPYDQRLALRADGTLAAFNQAGVLSAADVHVATRLGALAGEHDPSVLLAVALVSRAVRGGSVCLDLAEARVSLSEVAAELPWPELDGGADDTWLARVRSSPLVAAGVVHLDYDLVYFDRYWRQEVQLCDDLLARAARGITLVDDTVLASAERLFPGDSYAEQRAAALAAVGSRTTVLTGGPGTGKTTTVAGLLALLAAPGGRAPRIALAAPTGKAAARLLEAVQGEIAHPRFTEAEREVLAELSSSTLHRLLGSRPDNSTRFRHHRGNRLPHDIVVVDETSMVSLTMMARLVEALRPEARLILVGDHNQLASIDAGAVLADLVAGLPDGPGAPAVVGSLHTNHRSQRDIIELGEAIRAGDADAAVARLQTPSDEVTYSDQTGVLGDDLKASILEVALAVRAAARAGDAVEALSVLDRHRLLCAHRDGPLGVEHWNRQVEEWIAEATRGEGDDPLIDPWYVGRPVLVRVNDYSLGLHNGDVGVVIREPDGSVRVAFQSTGGIVAFPPSRLSAIETMHAMTIHKSQGSQAAQVTVLLPEEESRLLTRELFYTAVTRARFRVNVVGAESVVRSSLARRVSRASGLRQRLEPTR
ncbi:exodeoxyribonuclease V subunit alpha [Nocardioides sp. Bht2]|uniref:exodeoxyribonuclease V subunit alpha n=1 Tax=Nocardioides sp. Bht2 TaxID=3392297 RepID=UPI0039B4CA33